MSNCRCDRLRRYMINNCSVVLGKPLISGAAVGLKDLKALKVASDVGEPLSGRMLLFDALSAKIRIVMLRGRSLYCEAYGENAEFTLKFSKILTVRSCRKLHCPR
ncbi:hypothetical protein C5167_049224 [Papaver somniferum]|uniref:Uncharacterized protein n=1 Tax=Papaver somniferum TaxID=3469 RepID=A0A4Y7KPD7_PAPSO|nr:hypothetical protein C5167_049224 [Papaver somniferum]